MKSVVLSKCESEFIQRAILEGKRLDGRGIDECRDLKVTFGLDSGACQVHLGHTRVFAQVSVDVVQPNPSRPSEGQLFVNVELSPMAAPDFEIGRMSEASLEANRLIERCIVQSKAIDLESLCIVAGEKTWSIRVDVHVLNHDGNIVDCASIAAIAALAHFRRPDVTISGGEVTIHSIQDRQPVPLSCHHMPVCITFAFFDDGKYLILDPTEREELVMIGKMTVAMNVYREICMLHVGGLMSLHKDQIFRCTQLAAAKATIIVEAIKAALALDAKKRLDNEGDLGFVQLLKEELIITSKRAAIMIRLNEHEKEPAAIKEANTKVNDEVVVETDETGKSNNITLEGPGTASIGGGGENAWDMASGGDDDDDDDDDDSDIEDVEIGDWVKSTAPTNPKAKAKEENIVDLGGESSEEDDVVILEGGKTLK